MRFLVKVQDIAPVTVDDVPLMNRVSHHREKPAALGTVKVSTLERVKAQFSSLPNALQEFISGFTQVEWEAIARANEDPIYMSRPDGNMYYIRRNEKGNMWTLLRGTTVIVTGPPGLLFLHAARYERSALKLLMGYAKEHPPSKEINPSMLMQQLSRFRHDRHFSSGLDRISKVEQLDMVEQDHTFWKFFIPGLRVDKILHLGSGAVDSGSTMACYLMSDYVDCIDPRHGGCSGAWGYMHRRTWKDANPQFEKYSLIVSDVALGDELGQIDTQYQELADRLVGCNTLQKVMLGIDLSIQLRAIRKPRPHNLEVICLTGPTHQSNLRDHETSLSRDVVAANIKRNAAMYSGEFHPVRKKNKIEQYPGVVSQILNLGKPTNDFRKRYMVPCRRYSVVSPNRTQMIVTQCGKSQELAKRREYRSLCTDPDERRIKEVLDGEGYFELQMRPYGPLLDYNVEYIPCAQVQFRSLVRKGLELGFELVYQKQLWQMLHVENGKGKPKLNSVGKKA